MGEVTMHIRHVAIAVAGALIALGPLPARASSWAGSEDSSLPRFKGPILDDCTEAIPETLSVSGVTDNGRTIGLETFVVMDFAEGASIAKMKDRVKRKKRFRAAVSKTKTLLGATRKPYSNLDLSLRWSGFALLQPLKANGRPRKRTTDVQAIIDLAKSQLGGKRPAGSDVVYVLTDLDVTAGLYGNGVVGYADCIGGVRYRSRAFAVGEIFPRTTTFGPLSFYYQGTAKIAAHEIGHLMGAHHHYSNCGEGLPSVASDREVTPCTVMHNLVDLQSLIFSKLEGAVVRGHAAAFAK